LWTVTSPTPAVSSIVRARLEAELQLAAVDPRLEPGRLDLLLGVAVRREQAASPGDQRDIDRNLGDLCSRNDDVAHSVGDADAVDPRCREAVVEHTLGRSCRDRERQEYGCECEGPRHHVGASTKVGIERLCHIM
jgi:hypothetical protein